MADGDGWIDGEMGRLLSTDKVSPLVASSHLLPSRLKKGVYDSGAGAEGRVWFVVSSALFLTECQCVWCLQQSRYVHAIFFPSSSNRILV